LLLELVLLVEGVEILLLSSNVSQIDTDAKDVGLHLKEEADVFVVTDVLVFVVTEVIAVSG
jgi:hypothetical protein